MGPLAIVAVALILIIAFIMFNSYKDRRYFEKQGVYYAGNGTFSLFTNWLKGITMQKQIDVQYKLWKGKNLKIVGSRDFGTNSYTIMDQELLKLILVKDFDHFPNRRQFKTPRNDKVLEKMLISLTGDKWKTLRSKLSPTFTTGKIKRMYSLFDQSGKKFVKYIDSEMKKSGQIDLTDAYSKLTMDVIASAVCAMNSKAFDDPNKISIFEQMGKNLQLNFGGTLILKLIFMIAAPGLANILGFSFFPQDVQKFFEEAIKTTINQRKASGEKRDDFIQLMLEAREGQLKLEESELDRFEKDAIVKPSSDEKMSDLLDDDGIVSNCVLFILAGFDTTQSLLLFCAYALALNQDVQEKLREEVAPVIEESGGELTYDGLQKMNYLDMVINETMRFYPPAGITDRGCIKDYQIPGTDIIIKKGDGIIVPILGIHHDPELYPEPEKFDPERFSPENKSKISPYAFLPFGQGPRNCIGMRFALTEVKLAISKLVHNFNIEPSSKTTIPMQYSNAGSLKPRDGMWLALNSRN